MKIKPLCKNQGINDPGIIMFSLLSVIKMIKNIHATPPPPSPHQQPGLYGNRKFGDIAFRFVSFSIFFS